MRIKILAITVFTGFVMFSCNNKVAKNMNESKSDQVKSETVASEDIPYIVANRYFVRNDYKKEDLTSPKITSEGQFEKHFGMAPIMGPDGKPTAVDFSRQYVISVIGELTDQRTEIVPVSLQQKAGTIEFIYKINEGEKISATIRPVLLIIVDNKYQGEVKLVKN